MRFKIVLKLGQTTIAEAEGRKVDESYITIHDLDRVIETEQFLEKILGLRVHIMEAPE